MKIKKLHIENFKRFTDLTIDLIPETAKLVVLIGSNGCGKSSLFDAFKTWHKLKGYGHGSDDNYCKKSAEEVRASHDLVQIDFHQNIASYIQNEYRDFFYFRTAYRNSPAISVTSLSKLFSPLETVDNRTMIQNDATVDDNYQRLISKTLSNVYDEKYNDTDVKTLREEIIGKIRDPLQRLFPDLLLTELGIITEKAEFYFSKGTVKRYGYEKLSGGEKAAFDLLLDMVVKNEYYKRTIFCIDEPETHIHTKLQASLLKELFSLIKDESQLWIATHSFGMLKESKKLLEQHPGEVVFLNFDGFDFDDKAYIAPTSCDEAIWNKMLEISLDDYAPFLSSARIVFCEGTTAGKTRKDFDARCYSNIFKNKYPDTIFYSLGSCSQIEQGNPIVEFAKKISPETTIIRLIDRDDRSDEEVTEAQNAGIKVLARRHIESYLLDDEVLEKWCENVGQSDNVTEILKIKKQCVIDSVNRGNASDDIKSASNDICTMSKKKLQLISCGNTGEGILRDTISKLITEDTEVFKNLEKIIFK